MCSSNIRSGNYSRISSFLLFYGNVYYDTRISTTCKRNKIGNMRIMKRCSALALFLYLLGYLSRRIPFHSTKALLWRLDVPNTKTYSGLYVKCPTYFSDFNKMWNSSTDFHGSSKYQTWSESTQLKLGGYLWMDITRLTDAFREYEIV
jgi:succinate dehydrogenase hydrophobic anchor subunit